MINEVGNHYGKLTVLERAPHPEGRPKGAYWLCQCECGNQKVIRGADLRAGDVNSCGCLYGKHTIKDETGKCYGKLTVIKQVDERKRNSIQWLCKCDCGNEVIVSGADLRNSNVQSCGCLVKERSREANLRDLTNQRFGKLQVIEIDEEKSKINKMIYWKCKCDCGNIKSILGSNLTQGSTKSCGCLKTSYGEEYIESLLKNNNISYQKEYCFCGLYGLNNVALRFDFAIFNQEKTKILCLIEYDGIQHYKSIPNWGGEEGLKHRQENDNKKDLYCLEHNIKLIRIPYYGLESFNIEKLQEELNI